MPRLQIALQDGFEGDTVEIRVNGRVVFHQTGVQTQHQIGVAASLEESVPAGQVEVQVRLPDRKIVKTIPIEVAADTSLGLSVTENGDVEHRVSNVSFGYA